MQIIINLLVSGLAVVISSYVLPGVTVDSFLTAIFAAVVLGLVNMFVRPLMLFLTLPINILTLGLFSFVVNAVMILIVAALVPGFKVDGLGWAILFGIVLSVVASMLHALVV